MTQFRTVGPRICRMPPMSAPASRSRASVPAGKSVPHRATTPTSPVQVSAAAAAWTQLPPSVPIWLLPSARMTSSMVRLPTMITGRAPTAQAGPGPAAVTRHPRAARSGTRSLLLLLWRDFLVGQVQVDSAASVVDQRARVPQRAHGNHAEHELHRQVRGHGELGTDGLVGD